MKKTPQICTKIFGMTLIFVNKAEPHGFLHQEFLIIK